MVVYKISFFSGFFCGPYEKELIKDLLYDYERQNRPVLNESEPLVLTFGVSLTQIIDVVTMIQNRFNSGAGLYYFVLKQNCSVEIIFSAFAKKKSVMM